MGRNIIRVQLLLETLSPTQQGAPGGTQVRQSDIPGCPSLVEGAPRDQLLLRVITLQLRHPTRFSRSITLSTVAISNHLTEKLPKRQEWREALRAVAPPASPAVPPMRPRGPSPTRWEHLDVLQALSLGPFLHTQTGTHTITHIGGFKSVHVGTKVLK